MSVTQELFDRQVEHSIRTRRYGESVKVLLAKVSQKHRSRLSRLLKGDLRRDLSEEVKRYVNELNASATDSVRDFFGAEIDFQTNSLTRATKPFYRATRPRQDEVVNRFTRSPLKFGDGLVADKMSSSFSSIGAAELTKINAKVRRGIANGDSEADIIKSVLKTSRLSENHAKTLVVSNLTHAESTVKEAMLEANPDLFSGVVYSAILDSNTSRICSSLDGRIQSADNIKYRPPMHWNCRSTLVLVVKSKAALADTPSAAIDKVALSKVPDGQLDGQRPLKEDFSDWLKRQSHAVKLSYLDSDERVALFENGALKISSFLSLKGNPISLAALRVKDNLATFFAPVRQTADDRISLIEVSRPFQLSRSKKLQKELRDFYIAESTNISSPLSLVDYKGTSLAGKRSVRRRVNNTFDPRTSQVDPFTGEVKNTLYYDPDFTVYQERIDYMNNSKLLDVKQKEFINSFMDSVGDRVSINQKTSMVENIRVVLERYQKDRVPWENLSAVLRRELNYSVVNTSRILDRRSRSRAELFNGFTGDVDEPSVMILGETIPIKTLSDRKLDNERFIDGWVAREGRKVGRAMYYKRRAPWRAYLFGKEGSPTDTTSKIVDNYRKKAIKSVFYKDNPEGFYLRYGKLSSTKKIIQGAIKKKLTPNFLKITREGVYNYFTRVVREKYRSIVDLEFLYNRRKKRFLDKITPSILDSKSEDQLINMLATLSSKVASGITTDYDSLAIQLGQTVIEKWQPFFFLPSTMNDFHREGSRILEHMRDQGLIRINSRGVTRRAVVDLDTMRPSGAWKDTVSREVQVVDPDMLKLQSANRQVIMTNRFGVDNPRNKYYVVAGQKNYIDARGRDTGTPVITRSAYEGFDAKQLDKDFADMLNWQMSNEYEVDNEFATFIDYLVRFKDNRGNAAKYDELNLFRDEITRRGDQGYGLMESIRYHNARKKPFTVNARIDGRGRIYYNGYLTPTGGEIVRPFLNSAKATKMTLAGLDQIQISLGAVIGPGTEALTQAGRRDIFRRHEASLLRVGKMLTETTQRDRRIREFLEDPFVQSIHGEEIAKVARFALEYYRIHRHTGGDVYNAQKLSTYRSKLMGEADASASGLQVIALSTGNRGAAITSNVTPSRRKQRIYDLTAQDTVADPRFQAMQEELGISLTWEDLSKAAKYQNMIALYGAGQTGQTARVAVELANVLRKKDFTVTTRAEFLSISKAVKQKIKDAEAIGALNVADELKGTLKELEELIKNPTKIADDSLLMAAEGIHPDVAEFVDKYTNNRNPRVGPENFKLVAKILSEKLAERAPVTQTYIDFWKKVATSYAKDTKKVDIPWVTFDNKKLTQKYRPKIQDEVRFYDPESKRYVRNIYQMSSPDGKLKGKASIGDVRLGFAVNGNHSLDASLLRMYHLEGRQKNIFTASIHDAIFHNINELDEGTKMFFRAYQRARDFNNIKATLDALRAEGLSKELYQAYVKEAEELGFFDNGFTSDEILRPLKPGEDRYGIGP